MAKATRVPYARKAKLAKKWERIIQKAVKPLVKAEVDRAASAVRAGGKPISASAAKSFEKKLFAVLRPRAIMVAAEGWNLAGIELGSPSKKATDEDSEGVFVGSADDFLQVARAQDIEDYLKRTARSATAATAGRLDTIFNRAREWKDPDTGRGKTPRDIAAELEALGDPFSESYSMMLARTVTTWSANEGAAQRYEDAGAKRMIWYTTDDDLTCEYCRAMDGKEVVIGDSFAGEGDPVKGDQGGTLKLPFDVDHPPLHPNCRCTLLPDLGSLGEEKPPEPEELKPEEETTPPEEPTPQEEPVAPTREREPTTAREIMDRIASIDRSAANELKIEYRKVDQISQDLNRERINTKYGVIDREKNVLVKPPGTPEEIAEITERHEKARNHATQVFKKWQDEEDRLKTEVKAVLVHPDNRGGISTRVDAAFDTGGNWNARGLLTEKQQDSVREVLDKSINLWLSNERKEDFDQVHIAKSKKRRGSYSGGGIVIPTSGKSELDGFQLRTLVHEYAHHVEKQDPEVMKRTIAFRDARRKEDGGANGAIEKLSVLERSKAYESHEVSYRDKWQERGWGTTYPGKIYSHDSTEILTMGAERLYQDPFDFMTKDPEAFQLVVSIFRGVPEE